MASTSDRLSQARITAWQAAGCRQCHPESTTLPDGRTVTACGQCGETKVYDANGTLTNYTAPKVSGLT